ncbi:tripartite tricarboxylate transporter substrate-binding protein [Pseudomonas sp. MWU16-30317]|uniref:tripartite tricarboxylate transporter substrate-binding protein n=1 Tax=Pseudomonas sp. MWU16-30317 TaxID=2878095 RepID=UPI001CFA1CD6|nr:tripartite tricarboxylate transporter substrate-binding protein [Pseudomonas sp. MWU16-30317]
MINRRRFLASSGVLLAGASIGARSSWAQDTGERRMLFGYPPGALGTVVGTRMLELLASSGGPSYRLDNVEGRNTRVACETAKVAPGDGMTLLQAQSTTMCLLPNVYKTASYDPLKDFIPLTTVGEMTLSLTVGPAVPKSVVTLAHYFDWVSSNPEFNNVGFSIYGSDGHLATLILARTKGVNIKAQPYKGSLMMIKDLLGGQLAAIVTAAGNGPPENWASGKMRSLGVTTAERLSYWPSIPSLAEQGVSDMDLRAWYGWFAPSATPASVTGPLMEKIAIMQAAPAYTELQKQLLLGQRKLTPDGIRERIRTETARYAGLVEKYGLARID